MSCKDGKIIEQLKRMALGSHLKRCFQHSFFQTPLNNLWHLYNCIFFRHGNSLNCRDSISILDWISRPRRRLGGDSTLDGKYRNKYYHHPNNQITKFIWRGVVIRRIFNRWNIHCLSTSPGNEGIVAWGNRGEVLN